jgi:hypothetical protein
MFHVKQACRTDVRLDCRSEPINLRSDAASAYMAFALEWRQLQDAEFFNDVEPREEPV